MHSPDSALHKLPFNLRFVLLSSDVGQLNSLSAVVDLVQLVVDEGLGILRLALDLVDNGIQSLLSLTGFLLAGIENGGQLEQLVR